MKNFKLILKSLVNNDAAIDGARKKPWYFAIIIFFVSIMLSLVPVGVNELKNHLDKNFDNTTYNTQEAVTEFEKYLNENNITMSVARSSSKDDGVLVCDSSMRFAYPSEEAPQFVFRFSDSVSINTVVEECKEVSYFIFTPDTLYIQILNPQNKSEKVINAACVNAYKKIGEDEIKSAYVPVNIENGVDYTKSIQKTWANWKSLIRKFYRQTRLRVTGAQVGVSAIVAVSISLIMGFMVWVLTRGKTNAYRLFTVWDCFKISFWAGLAPGILTCGLGFLFAGFGKVLFVLLLGVRVMWLTMKSLKPDGSGYAAN